MDAKIGTFYKHDKLINAIAQLNKWRTDDDVVWNAQALKRTNTYLRGLRVFTFLIVSFIGLRLQLTNKSSFVCSGFDLQDRDDSDQVEFRTLMQCEEKLFGSKQLVPAIEKYKALNIDIKYF